MCASRPRRSEIPRHGGDDSILIARRRYEDDVLWLAFNVGAAARQVPTPNGAREAILALQSARVQGAHVDLPPHSAIFLRLAP